MAESGSSVFDTDHGYKFVKRIPTWRLEPGETVEIVKGIAAASAERRPPDLAFPVKAVAAGAIDVENASAIDPVERWILLFLPLAARRQAGKDHV
jgi:hypothetical protein